jgi:hypothetical protein
MADLIRQLRWHRVTCLAVLLPGLIGCSRSTSPAPSLTTGLHGEVTDPTGDAVSNPRVAVTADLVRATADVAAGNLTVVVQFAPRTLDLQSTRVSLLLDVDRDGSTGIRQGDGIGADFAVDLVAATGQAAITKADPAGCAARQSCFTPAGSTTIGIGTDSLQVVVPLSSLGGVDGRLNFQMNAYALVAPGTTVIFDFMPDNNQPPGRVQ